MTTIKADTPAVAAVWHAITGGKFRVRLLPGRTDRGHRHGEVLDDAGNVIGSASDYTYRGRGWAVHTKPYGGFVEDADVILVNR